MSIVINTPTSNTGRALASRLLDAGERITVLSREKKKVDELHRRGARVIEGSFEEPSLLAEALEGAEALFWLVISSMGAHTGPGTGAVGPAREIENEFEAKLPAVVSLRPGIFMENFLLSAEMIAKAGQIFVPIQPGKRWPLVATADIAAKAACWLLDRGWTGHYRVGVHGPQDLSTGEAAAIIASAVGKPVQCIDATLDQARGALTGMGMPDFVVNLIMEQYVAFRDGRLDPAEPRTPETTTPTTLAEFARTTLVPAIHNVSSAVARS